MGNKIVVGIGELLWDVLPEGKVLGGAPANFAYHALQLGMQGYAISAIGKDELGAEIKEVLAQKKLHAIIAEVDFPTGTVQVSLDSKGVPQYEIKEHVAWDNIPFTPELKQLAQKTDAVCFGSLAQRSAVSRNTIQCFLNEVSSSALKIFDINLRQSFYDKEIIEDSLQHANILKINDEELEIIATMFNYHHLSETEICHRLLRDFSLNIVVLTKGAKESIVISDAGISQIDTPKVCVADTVGAGDSFSGAFIASLLQGKSIREAHDCGVKVSAFVCTQHGAMPLHPQWK